MLFCFIFYLNDDIKKALTKVSASSTVFICINRSREFHKTEGSKHLHLVVVLEVHMPCLCSITSRRSEITKSYLIESTHRM